MRDSFMSGDAADQIVVTGLGVVTPIGTGVVNFWDALMRGDSGGARISSFDPSDHSVQIACEVKDFDPKEYMEQRDVVRTDRFQHMGVAAADMAWAMAGLEDAEVPPERIGAIVSSSMGGFLSFEKEHTGFLAGGPRKVSPLTTVKVMVNGASGVVSIKHGLMGPSYSVASACATGGHAIGDALLYLKAGMADVMIAGATDAGITPVWVAGFARTGALSRNNDDPLHASRPFDALRDGFVIGEGAGALVLERREVAEQRGAPIMAELAGYWATSDAFHVSQPHPEGSGAVLAMKGAIRAAGLAPEDIDHLNAHGTSTPFNDRVETAAIKEVFGTEAKRLAICANKSQTGHLLGAAGAVEAVATVMTIDKGVIPGTINYGEPDPDCDLDYVTDGPREVRVRAALSNSFGFGGHNASLLFKPA